MIQLDVLRAIAILLVLGQHPLLKIEASGAMRWPALIWFRYGWTGVDLFFVLSGFLVGGLLLKEIKTRGSVQMQRFIVRRILKIWPAYYCLLLFAIIRSAWQTGGGGLRAAMLTYLPNLVHAQNYFGSQPLGPTWSLAVEEHFYLALPVLLVFLTRNPHSRKIHLLPYLTLLAAIACLVLRVVILSIRPHFGYRIIHIPTHMRIDALATGVLLAYLYHLRPSAFARIASHRCKLLFIGAMLILPAGIWDLKDSRYFGMGIYTLVYLGYASILIACVHAPVGAEGGLLGRLFETSTARLIAWLGTFSYSIYLWMIAFFPFTVLIASRLNVSAMNPTAAWALTTAIWIGGACIIGIVMGKLIEFPALAIRDRLFPARASALDFKTSDAATYTS